MGGGSRLIRSSAQTSAVAGLLVGGQRAWIGMYQQAYDWARDIVSEPIWLPESLSQQTESDLIAGAAIGDSYLDWADGEEASFGNARCYL